MRPPPTQYVAGRHREWVLLLSGERFAWLRLHAAFVKAVSEGTLGLEPSIRRPRALYVISELDGMLRGACCFTLGFDPRGEIPRDFSLPLRDLTLRSGFGPDLGAGPICLAHARQCAAPWHAERLWGGSEEEVLPVVASAQELLRSRLRGGTKGAPDDRRGTSAARRRADRPAVVELAERKAEDAFGTSPNLSQEQLVRGRQLAAQPASDRVYSQEEVDALEARHRREISLMRSEIELLQRRLAAADCRGD